MTLGKHPSSSSKLFRETINSVDFIDDYKCERCNKKSKIKISQEIKKPPIYLLVHLNRLQSFDGKIIRTSVIPDKQLRISNIDATYKLRSIIVIFIILKLFFCSHKILYTL